LPLQPARVSLLSARNRGYKVAVLTATDMGYLIYKRLGFKEIANWDYIHEDWTR